MPGSAKTVAMRDALRAGTQHDHFDAQRTISDNGGLWRPEQAAEFLQISRSAVLALARQGKIPSVKIGRRTVRFLKSALEEYARRGGERFSGGTR